MQPSDRPAGRCNPVRPLVGNSIDTSSFSLADHLVAAQAGTKILFNMRDYNIAYQGTGLVTTQKFIARNRDIARRFVKIYVEAIHAIQTNPTLSKSALAKYRKPNDEKKLEEAYQTIREIVRPKPYPSPEGFKTIFKDLSDRIPAAKTANPKEFMDTSLLEELDR